MTQDFIYTKYEKNICETCGSPIIYAPINSSSDSSKQMWMWRHPIISKLAPDPKNDIPLHTPSPRDPLESEKKKEATT